AHEMLFGYGTAALAGFLLTAIPNWTGRLPVAGTPLVVLFMLWCAGRLVMLAPDTLGLAVSLAIDGLFLPLLLAICAREIIAVRRWKNLKILAGLLTLTLANIGFHLLVTGNDDATLGYRLALGAYVMLLAIMGGRIVPTFTRNWLIKRHQIDLPAPYDWLDTLALVTGLVALILWVNGSQPAWIIGASLLAGGLHTVRLWRWRGWLSWDEQLLFTLHLAYSFVPMGFLLVGIAQWGGFEPVAALHVWGVGGVGLMTLVVMARSTRGHTGIPLVASTVTVVSHFSLLAAALLRPLTSIWPDMTRELLAATGLCWILAFALYLLEYGSSLLRRRRLRGD
ncbi:MAG: NnrS family protein, partial [Alphaproteobacteria bacterium]|nr:NnrS family protein [Alphaproteobacteria bacterium]